MTRIFAISLAAALLLGACVNQQPKTPNVNLAGYPQAFKDGYADGCATARAAIGSRRDEARFKADAQYAQGWRDGHDACGKR
jgi:hypothetical protein